MGIIGRTRQFLSDRYDIGVVFVHVPKCGGTSVEETLRKVYRFSHQRIFPMETLMAVRTLSQDDDLASLEIEAYKCRKLLMAYALQRRVKCITGHSPFDSKLQTEFAHTYRFVTVLREPVARFSSHYRHFYRSGTTTSVDMELDEFLETPRALSMGHAYASYFSGLDHSEDLKSARALSLTKAALEKLDLVGYLDRMNDFAASLSQMISRPLKIGYLNKISTRANAYGGDITSEQKKKIAKICEPDLEVYDHIRSLRS